MSSAVFDRDYISCHRCGLRIHVHSETSGYCASCSHLTLDTADTSWMAGGLCAQVDPELWFPGKGSHAGVAAKRVCNGDATREPCPVREKCLRYAVEHPDLVGVWGGTSNHERQAMRQEAA